MDFIIETDVECGRAGERKLLLDLVRPSLPGDAPRPALVFLHGGGWRSGDKSSAHERLKPYAALGVVCASVGYRLSPEAPFPAQIHDAKCAVRFLRAHAERYGIDSARVGAWGSSAGGHLAALLGTTAGVVEYEGDGGWDGHDSSVCCVCNTMGPTHLAEHADHPTNKNALSAIALLMGVPLDQGERLRVAAEQASPLVRLKSGAPPFLMQAGMLDELVAFEPQFPPFVARAKELGVPCELLIYPEVGHGGPEINDDPKVMAFFKTHLLGEK